MNNTSEQVGLKNSSGAVSPAKVISAIFIGATCALVVNTLPVFLTVLARGRQLDEAQSGLVAFADLGGIAIGTIAIAMLPAIVAKLTWRNVAALGIVILIAADLLSIVISEFSTFLIVRSFAGIGAGMAMAVTYAILADSNATRDLAIFNVVQMGSGAFGVRLLSPLAESFGVGGLYGAIAALGFVALVVTRLLPTGARNDEKSADKSSDGELPSLAGWLSIACVFLYFFGVGAIYAFMAFMGIAWGGDAAQIEENLSTILFAAMLGGVTIAILGHRFALKPALVFAYFGLIAALILLTALKPVGLFLIIGCLFGFTWNLLTPLQFEAVTRVDGKDSTAMLVNAATLGGIAVGPAIAGFLVTESYLEVNLMGIAACVASFILIFVALRVHARDDM